jgi:hypothetical protein
MYIRVHEPADDDVHLQHPLFKLSLPPALLF